MKKSFYITWRDPSYGHRKKAYIAGKKNVLEKYNELLKTYMDWFYIWDESRRKTAEEIFSFPRRVVRLNADYSSITRELTTIEKREYFKETYGDPDHMPTLDLYQSTRPNIYEAVVKGDKLVRGKLIKSWKEECEFGAYYDYLFE